MLPQVKLVIGAALIIANLDGKFRQNEVEEAGNCQKLKANIRVVGREEFIELLCPALFANFKYLGGFLAACFSLSVSTEKLSWADRRAARSIRSGSSL